MPIWTESRIDGDELRERFGLVMIADIAEADIACFREYESRVLPLLPRHGGRLERRLQSVAGTFEAHVISFADEPGYRGYLADPDRAAARDLLDGCDIQQRAVIVHAVPNLSAAPLPAGGTGRCHDLDVAAVTARLTEAQHDVQAAFANLTEQGWARRLDARQRRRLVGRGHFPEYGHELTWAAREVAGHLRDSAEIFTDRIRQLRSGAEPRLTDFVTDDPARLSRYRTQPLPALLAELETAQAMLRQSVAAVQPEELAFRGVHEVDGKLCLADVLGFLPRHQQDHAAQLEALVAQIPRS